MVYNVCRVLSTTEIFVIAYISVLQASHASIGYTENVEYIGSYEDE